MKKEFKIGQMIHINHLFDEKDSRYDGKEGKIKSIDSIGQLHGTWGSLAVIPEVDDFYTMEKCSICGKYYAGYGHNAYPINEGKCCDSCHTTVVIPERIKLIK